MLEEEAGGAMFCCCISDEETVAINVTPAMTSSEYSPQPDKAPRAVTEQREEPAKEAEGEAEKKVEEEPAQEPSTFTVEIDKGSGALGLYLDLSDGMSLYVCRVNTDKSSPAQVYNARAAPGETLKAGDYILSVNEASGSSAALARAVKEGGKLTMKIRRPIIATHKVKKTDTTMGLDLQFARQSTVLCISKVIDGAVMRSGRDIQHGDRIVRVNGKEGDCEQLISEMKASAEPEILTSRCLEVFEAYEKGFRPDKKPMDNPNL